MKRFFISAMLICFVLLFSSCQEALLGPEAKLTPQQAHSSRFAQILDSLRYTYELPALGAAIITADTILYADAVGCRSYGGTANVTADDKFHLGSCTKAITAAMIATLVEDGHLNWQTTLSEAFPEYVSIMPEAFKNVTVRNLLTHSSGFERTPSITPESGSLTQQRINVLIAAIQRPPVIERGKYLYSNMGYMIAASIAEKVTGEAYETLMEKRIFKPLGLTSYGWGPMGSGQPLQHTIYGAAIAPDQEADLMPSMNPAGRLHLCLRDWARFIQWVLKCENGDQPLISINNARILTESYVTIDSYNTYACGWNISSQQMAGGRTLTHAGSNGLNLCAAWLAPLKKFAVITATNINELNTGNLLNGTLTRLINYYNNGI